MNSVSRKREDCSHKKFQITAIVPVTLDMKSRKGQYLDRIPICGGTKGDWEKDWGKKKIRRRD